MRTIRGFAVAAGVLLATMALSAAPAAGQGAPATPPEMVATCNTLADAILAVKACLTPGAQEHAAWPGDSMCGMDG